MGIFRSFFSLKNIVNQNSNITISNNTKITNSRIGNVSINGNNITGNNITVIGKKVYVDGQELTEYNDSKVVNITITGDVDSIEGGNNIDVYGNVNKLTSSSGNINIRGSVHCSVKSSSGDITVEKEISGDVETSSGNVKAGVIEGNVKTVSGNIRGGN